MSSDASSTLKFTLKLILKKVNEMSQRAVPLPLTIQACSLHFGADDLPFRIHFKRCFKIRNGLFSALAPRSGFGAAKWSARLSVYTAEALVYDPGTLT